MTNPMLVFRIGYMEAYDGPDDIEGGGAWITEHGEGGEMWNFLPDADRCYGYVMTRAGGGINLKRVTQDHQIRFQPNDEIDGVDIVFIAKRPQMGQVVIGWYRNATVIHRAYRKRPDPAANGRPLDYLCEVSAEEAVLLPEKDRTFRVPFAPIDGYGPGQANVWYGDAKDERTLRLVESLRRHIKSKDIRGRTRSRYNSLGRRGFRKPLDKDTIVAIESASMAATRRHFSQHYKLVDVCRDNRGWDITASSKSRGAELHLEVKGHLGDVIQFELTPNEFEKMQIMRRTYRVCVVRRALECDMVEVFVPSLSKDGNWVLKDAASGAIVKLSPRIAARASQIL